jgi:nucleotide-binding universal stress UspA family protein
MIATRTSGTGAYTDEARAPRLLFVPVDGSPASSAAVDLAIRVAQQSDSEILLVDMLSHAADDLALEPLVSEEWSPPPTQDVTLDEEGRTARRLRQVLLPLQGRVSEAGIAVSSRLLHGGRPARELRDLVTVAGPERALVLCNPLDLLGPLRELTGDLLLEPPCTVYLAASRHMRRSTSAAVAARLLSWLWRRINR